MHPAALQLEQLRQNIEEAAYESGNLSDYLDRGNPSAAQAKEAHERMDAFNRQVKAQKAELSQLLATVRSEQPQALQEWVDYHVGILRAIAEEKSNEPNAGTRRHVAKSTLQEWEKVRAGELDYVNINWYFLKDYREQVRTVTGGANPLNRPRPQQTKTKAWWQFWK